MNRNNTIYIGVLTKTHGIKDEMILALEDKHKILQFIKWETLLIEIDGLLVPFFIDNARQRDDQSWIVKMDDISSVEELQELLGAKVFFPRDAIVSNNNAKNSGISLLKYSIEDSLTGRIGTISEVIEQTYNPILKVDSGKGEILIPYNDAIVDKIDHKQKTVFVNLPEGLLDLYI